MALLLVDLVRWPQSFESVFEASEYCRSVNPHVAASMETVTASSKSAAALARQKAPQIGVNDDRVTTGISSFAFQVRI